MPKIQKSLVIELPGVNPLRGMQEKIRGQARKHERRGRVRTGLYLITGLVLCYGLAWGYIPYDTGKAISLITIGSGIGYLLGRT